MNTLVDVVVSSVSLGPSGESEYGPWQIHNLNLEGRNEKFSYFERDGEVIPAPGMMIRVFDYESKQKGEYMNHTVKRLTYGKDQPIQTQNTTKDNRPADLNPPVRDKVYQQERVLSVTESVLTSYHKDYIIALIDGYGTMEAVADNMDKAILIADELLDASLRAGVRAADMRSGANETPQTEKPDEDDFAPVPDDDDIPF